MKAINVVTIMLMVGLPCLSWLPIGDGQQGEVPRARRPTSAKMIWVSASNSTALCNDFTRAGFFIRRNTASNNWIVFLEGGGLCYNTNTCNKRFFVSKIRKQFTLQNRSFSASMAWDETVLQGQDPAKVISPLMSSMQCFDNVLEYFPSGLSSSIEGRDILDIDPVKNPLFYDYNHVVVPYCSSDVWLGETSNTEAVKDGTSQCDCLTPASVSNPCFHFNPRSPNLQFTFRGKIIYQSVIEQLLTDHDMSEAGRVILAGSSSGGVGVINHAQWTRDKFADSSIQLMVVSDSSWFINFQGGIDEVFNGGMVKSPTSTSPSLFEILQSQNIACNDTSRLGYPCCVSAQCILTQQGSDGELQYYPKDTPTFALFSIYDIYLLAPALQTAADINSAQQSVNMGNFDAGIDVVIDFLRVSGEYGGTMNYTLDVVTAQESFLSYYVTQCFQHTYLATSTLWGEDGHSLFGSNPVDLAGGSTSFRHSVASDRWRTLHLASNESKNPITILDALTSWVVMNGSGQAKYTDTCHGVLCNPQCPDQVLFGELTSNNWHLGVKIFIIALVVGIAVICVIVKLQFDTWLYVLETKLNRYLDSLDNKQENPAHARPQCPACDNDNAISLSCLDLSYYVTLYEDLKDEKSDRTAPFLLHNLEDNNTNTDAPSDKEKGKNIGEKSILTLKKTIKPVDDLSSTTSTEVSKETLSGRFTKEILKGISVYFNPGNMVGIMGPSGSGKTTLLDVLTGRRTTGTIEGSIYVNGTPVDEIREWYIANTGYVLQLALPYYEELTVRENLTLAAQLKLPKNYTLREKFERVEQIMEVTGLLELSETVVGGTVGAGLSGGQKKRLVIALQLLTLPSIIFLDEPTSGLDATGSLELLSHLNKIAESNHTVILTIHQPRLEIFHMFHQLVLLSDGKVSYHDVPDRAYETFVSALTSKYLERGLVIPSLVDVHNPADVIMDMLGSPKMRQIITEDYQNSEEPKLIKQAIMRARWKSKSTETVESLGDVIKYVVYGTKTITNQNFAFTRMAVLEARAAKRMTKVTRAFLPFMIIGFAFVLGTSYFQVDEGLLIISGMCVFSTTSALFMFPAMYPYYTRALEVYKFEKADGVGKAYDLVIQGFVHFSFLALFPMIFAVTAIYLLLINHKAYNFLVYLQVLVVNICLNQTWIALLIALICAFPISALRLSPVIAAVAGFSSGFFIPVGALHWGYRWLVYINPNYYGLSSVAFLVLSDLQTDCTGSQIECYISSGPYTLNQFFFDAVNPYLHLAILLSFSIFFLVLAIFANRLRNTTITFILKRIRRIFKKLRRSTTLTQINFDDDKQTSYLTCIQEEDEDSIPEDDTEDSVKEKKIGVGIKELKIGRQRVKSEGDISEEAQPSRARDTTPTADDTMLHDINEQEEITETTPLIMCQERKVWRPKRKPHLPDLVKNSKESHQRKPVPAVPPLDRSTSSIALLVRQQQLLDRVQATQAVLKESDEILSPSPSRKKPHMSFKEASQRIISVQKRQSGGHPSLSDIVTQYQEKMKKERESSQAPRIPKSPMFSPFRFKPGLTKQSSILGAIPIDKWHEMMEESQESLGSDSDGNEN